ncbi:class I SAM-dependent methyltransferase [Bacillus massiliglaciei]|uniref:class I SAM-dependent methyltransferase n=1 Tax=Bacillus massiliglaciei TaxID=1816693 RepID=UPI000B176197|nr:methyltransferase [Bacillus massiliglaciei]
MKKKDYEAFLHINTGAIQKSFYDSLHYNRYEPTPYQALEVLFEHWDAEETDRLIDIGCGKGRLGFFADYWLGMPVLGIEMNRRFVEEAIENRESYLEKTGRAGADIQFECCLAEEYHVQDADTVFYFFNPFSVQIFMKVVRNILRSAENKPRNIRLVLYYSSADYLFYLENQTPFELLQEIAVPGLTEHDPSDKFSIYSLFFSS